MKKIITVFYLVVQVVYGWAQVNTENYQISVEKSTNTIEMDGILDEEIWSVAEKATGFMQNFPRDDQKATFRTEVMITFDQEFLYVAGTCYEAEGNPHTIQSLRRDFGFSSNDGIHIYIDTYNDFTNGFAFGLSPRGVQREGILFEGQQVSTDWDNKWFSEVYQGNGYWSFEMAIPFNTIRYKPENKEWNLQIIRNDLANNERTVWSPVPSEQRASNMAFAGKVLFRDGLPSLGKNISLIPFAATSMGRDFENDTENFNPAVGMDAKVGITPALNLDLTFNPDFSQVEVDRQVTNLSRFEIFFPERRQFFLENSDLFSQNGFPNSRPFFSRRIGIIRGNDQLIRQIPILYGARLSGKINNDWRIGLLNMQTKQAEEFGLPAQNFSVGVVQRKIFSRSNISFLIVNKQNQGVTLADTSSFEISTDVLRTRDNNGQPEQYIHRYNRVVGMDYNLFSRDNKWNGNFFYHRSLFEGADSESFAYGSFLGYTERNFSVNLYSNGVGANHEAETGFIQRQDVRSTGTFSSITFWPESNVLSNHGLNINGGVITNGNWERTDYDVNLTYQFRFLNTSEIEFGFKRNYQLLRRDFKPTGSDALLAGTDYIWSSWVLNLQSDRRKLLSAEMNLENGGFYSGEIFTGGISLNYRYQPFGNVSLDFEYNSIIMPGDFTDAEFVLFGPRFDLTFSRSLFLTTFVQYNSQIDNLNINARLQWRFAPASDFFIVYTDNYLPENMMVRNRGLALKLTYWLNL